MAEAIVPVILCGGSGTRLWPRSRAALPKPFLALLGDDATLFQATLSRCSAAPEFAPPVIVAGGAHVGHVEAQLPAGSEAQVIVEPAARNTAAAIALAALRLPPETVMMVCPSDHHIGDCAAFSVAAIAAAALARQRWLVAFGIRAERAETGFGYIRQGEPLGDAGFKVARFVEKPDAATAAGFVAEGGYHWNGGIFVFTAGDYLAELAQHRPELAEAARQAVERGAGDGGRFHPEAASFARIAAESVDYAVMENTARAAVVLVDMAWSDIGNWPALHAVLERDEAGNSVRGRAELVDCRNVLVASDGPRVSVIGASDIVVVVDGDEVLVTTAAAAQQVGKLPGARGQ